MKMVVDCVAVLTKNEGVFARRANIKALAEFYDDCPPYPVDHDFGQTALGRG